MYHEVSIPQTYFNFGWQNALSSSARSLFVLFIEQLANCIKPVFICLNVFFVTALLYVYSKRVVCGYFRFGMNLDTGVQDIILRLAVISSIQVSSVYMFNINIRCE